MLSIGNASASSPLMSPKRITIPVSVELVEPGIGVAAPNELLLHDVDPWKLRDNFFIWPADNWKSFPQKSATEIRDMGPFVIRHKDDFLEWQKLLTQALVRPPREWQTLEPEFKPIKVRSLCRLFYSQPIQFEWNGQIPFLRISTTWTIQAIIATIQMDKLQGAPFKLCARHDCNNPPFKVESRQKIYCSNDCAHLVAVRNQRARDAEGKNTKKRAANKKREKKRMQR
jgi:hypothetical protein